MNLKTLLLHAALGVLSGVASLLCMPSSGFCCCGVPLAVVVPILIGSMAATLLTSGRTYALRNTMWGVGHGLFAAALATGTVMVGLNGFTSDENVTSVVAEYHRQIEEARDAFREEAEKNASEQISEEERERMEKLLTDLAGTVAQLKKDPALTRSTVAQTYGLFALLFGFLAGAAGGFAGHLTFGRRRDADGGGGRPPRERPDPDRAQIPEQPKPWWEQ